MNYYKENFHFVKTRFGKFLLINTLIEYPANVLYSPGHYKVSSYHPWSVPLRSSQSGCPPDILRPAKVVCDSAPKVQILPQTLKNFIRERQKTLWQMFAVFLYGKSFCADHNAKRGEYYGRKGIRVDTEW